jgi:hypothetical protein
MPVTNVKSQWVSGNLVFYDKNGAEICTIDGNSRQMTFPSGSALAGAGVVVASPDNVTIALDGNNAIAVVAGVYQKRVRASASQVNAGLELLAAVAGYKYRLIDVTLIAIGGNAATATSVDILATQGAGSVKLIAAAVAALTRSAVVKPNSANVTVLTDGASFVANDVNTPITIGKTGSSLATASDVDVILTYAIEV